MASEKTLNDLINEYKRKWEVKGNLVWWEKPFRKCYELGKEDERKKCIEEFEKMIDELIIDMSGEDNIKEAIEHFEIIRHQPKFTIPRFLDKKRLFEELHKYQLGILFRLKEVELNNLKINQIPKNQGEMSDDEKAWKYLDEDKNQGEEK